MRKICVFTGTRAEYGILSGLMRKIKNNPDTELQIVATNMHLSPEYGLTYKEIEADGFKIDRKVEMLLSSDSPAGTVKSMGLGTIGFADALQDLRPDMVVILGDRYEMLAAAQAALIFQIPVAHLHGGEITEGAYDDAIRHAITKLSSLHFTSTEEYRQNVIQMGEQPERVFNVGALGVDNIAKQAAMPLEELERSLGIDLKGDYVVVTFHPVTTEPGEAGRQVKNLVEALQEVVNRQKILITMPNSDADSRAIVEAWEKFAAANPGRVFTYKSLGRTRFYSALKHAKAMIGNSSSGLIEAPSFHIPTLNIGNRQKGRARGESVVDCGTGVEEIRQGLARVLSAEMAETARKAENPYQKANTLGTIFDKIANCPLEGLTIKHFHKK